MPGHDAEQGSQEHGGQPGQPANPWSSQGPGIPPGAMPGWGPAPSPHTSQGGPPSQPGWQPPQQTESWPSAGQGQQAPPPGNWPPPANQGWQQPSDATWAGPGGYQPQPAGATWAAAGGQAPPQGGMPGAPAPGGWGTQQAPPTPAFARPAIEVPGQQPASPGQWVTQAATQPAPPLGRKRTIPLGIFIGAALVVALGAAGAVWAFTRAGSDGASAESARMLPPSTLMYMTMTTDAAARQWVQLSQLLTRLGVDGDARAARDQSAREEGLNWDEDIAPFLGGQASIAITGMTDGMPSVIAVLETSDAEKAWERITRALDEESDTKPVDSSYRGVTIRTYSDSGMEISLVRKDRYLIVSNSLTALKTTLDIEAGSGDSLAASDRFKAARAAITGDVLFFTYMDLPELAKLGSDFDPTFGAQPVNEMLASAGLDQAGLALAASAETTGFKLQWQLVGVDSSRVKVKLPAAGGESRLARRAPDDTLVYLYGNDFYNGLLKAMRQSVDQLRSDPNSADMVSEFQSAWDDITAELGFDLDKDLFAHITGEYAIAAGAADASADAPWVLGMGGVKDTAAVGRSLNRLTDWGRSEGYRISTPRVGATTVTEATVDGQGVSYALVDSDVLLGFGLDTVRRSLESKGKLADNPAFQEALKGLPGDRVLTGFLDLQKVLDLVREGGMDDMLDSSATRNLRYLSFAATQQDDRYGGVVFLRVAGE